MTESASATHKGWSPPVWPLRRTIQVLVVLTLFGFPILARYSHYLSARQLDKVMEKWDGSLQGKLLAGTDGAARIGLAGGEGGVPERRPRKAILERTRGFYGSPWSMTVFGLSMTDLLAGAESIAASRSVRWVLLSSLLVPLLATALLGRVFCGYICPMGFLFDITAKGRTLLQKLLEIRPLSVQISRRNKYVLLAVGLLITLAGGLPVLHYIYPPALIGREAHGFVMALFDQAEGGLLGFALVGLTGASLLLVGLILLELFLVPRFFCQSLCPGGAFYSLLGRFRLLRVRRRLPRCDLCALCNPACPRGLSPMADEIGMECDNCGVCVDLCPTRALTYRISLTDAGLGSPPAETGGEAPSKEQTAGSGGASSRGGPSSPSGPPGPSGRKGVGALAWVLLVVAASSVPGSAHGHHILGIPHYAYDDSYPQAPVLKLKQSVGEWDFQLTGYPGNPQPGERSQVHVYMTRRSDGLLFQGPLGIRVWQQRMLGPREAVHEGSEMPLENVFKFFFSYPEEGNYEVQLSYEDGVGTSTLTLPMVVGNPGSPLATLGTFAGGIFLLVLVVRAVRIKRARALRRREILAGNGTGEGRGER